MSKRSVKRLSMMAAGAAFVVLFLVVGQTTAENGLTPQEELGEHLYFDRALSEPDGQSCSDCHLPSAGFVDPDWRLPVSQGIFPDRFGDRNSPASAYAMYAPPLYWDDGEGLYIGGQFWDGRATGEVLGDPLADQALGPFLNPVEMANPSMDAVVADALDGEYGELFEELCGDMSDVEAAYNCIAESIAAFERTELFGQFNSTYDIYLQACLAAAGDPDACARGVGPVAEQAGKEVFTNKEWQGFQLFVDEGPGGAMCVACHVADWVDPADYAADGLDVVVPQWTKAYFPPDGMIPPVFTDFTYDNLGVPKNWDNPFLYQDPAFNPEGEDFVDLGLARFLADRPDLWPSDPGWTLAAETGKFKVMTLRNIAETGPWAHNGFFQSLKDITHFYNTRDALGACEGLDHPKPGKNCWPAPEVPETINVDELGNLGLSKQDEANLVKFMKTLSDGGKP